ncbi:hypothetical protein SAMN00790413_00440 [Deinococcus hopiensis KR-140]|uniref:Transposase IS701-like DDE domain-containing protein n=1 Tax=Deinococcus hopiensis KR-140 TaxID=695939 RepID=A0A1W1V8A7_9DEIO|nr:hypothetical protein SAMN00790413_00440 [Deinococcus hopiensis KR-140]
MAALNVLGLADDSRFGTCHRVLNQARWFSLHPSRVLLGLWVTAFVPTGPLVLGLDGTVERRTGVNISAKGIYRDPVRSSHGHFVKASGLRWLSLMLPPPLPWAQRIWALPFLTARVPSETLSPATQTSAQNLAGLGTADAAPRSALVSRT